MKGRRTSGGLFFQDHSRCSTASESSAAAAWDRRSPHGFTNAAWRSATIGWISCCCACLTPRSGTLPARSTRGPWIAHVSGATPLAALDPHVRRFSVHPLQTFTRARGAEQLDGAWAAVTAEDDAARARARWLATLLNLHPFDLQDEMRTVYHAGAAIASNYLVTLYRAASRLFEAAGAPPEALLPLMRRTIDNGFELTGPIARGDWSTVDAHLAAIRQHAPELEAMYQALAEVTAE